MARGPYWKCCAKTLFLSAPSTVVKSVNAVPAQCLSTASRLFRGLLLPCELEGHEITTIEGLAQDGQLDSLQAELSCTTMTASPIWQSAPMKS